MLEISGSLLGIYIKIMKIWQAHNFYFVIFTSTQQQSIQRIIKILKRIQTAFSVNTKTQFQSLQKLRLKTVVNLESCCMCEYSEIFQYP